MMSKAWEAIKKNFAKIVNWLHLNVVDFFENIARDVKSLRASFNYIYLCLYVWLIWYCVTHYRESASTAITATAAIVSAIFSGYVLSKTFEKKTSEKPKDEDKPKSDPDENGAGD